MDFDGKFLDVTKVILSVYYVILAFFCTNFRKEGALWMNI